MKKIPMKNIPCPTVISTGNARHGKVLAAARMANGGRITVEQFELWFRNYLRYDRKK